MIWYRGYAVVTKGSVHFWTKVTIFLKSWSGINQGGNLGITVKMKQESNGNDKFEEWREVKII